MLLGGSDLVSASWFRCRTDSAFYPCYSRVRHSTGTRVARFAYLPLRGGGLILILGNSFSVRVLSQRRRLKAWLRSRGSIRNNLTIFIT